ncbi:MAG: hypothetical protein PHV26_02475 [Candidatus Pacebacteria bacterium]|nr:hypothetical protein [Candidatus Paceibacterota bacterium]
MKKKLKKQFIFLLILFMFFLFTFAFGRELEIDYPEISRISPQNTETPVYSYFLYIFSFVVYVVGLVALLALILAGLKYLTSMGKSESKEAKERFLRVFLGVLIILSSFLVLNTISPSFVELELDDLGSIPPISIELPEIPPVDYGPIVYSPEVLDLLERIDNLSRKIKIESVEASEIVNNLRDATEFCSCSKGQSLCSSYQEE